MVWHMVTNEEGLVLAVYGEALLADAQEKARSIQAQTGCRTFLHSGTFMHGNRPYVGTVVSMRGFYREVGQ